MSFDQTQWLGTYESLNFTLAAYSLNGTFLGFEQLTDQFQWCKKKSKATVAGGVLENADGESSSGASSSSSAGESSSADDGESVVRCPLSVVRCPLSVESVGLSENA